MPLTFLYIFPHPDDESFGPAPAIAKQLREGHEVHLLTLTKGGATKQRHRLGLTVEQMGEVREREMQCVSRVLGLSGLTVLDLPDGGMKYMDPVDVEEVIEERVRALRPQVVVTYAVHGISGHPDHLVCHAVVKRLFCRLRREADADAPQRMAFFTVVAWPDEEDRIAASPVQLRRSKVEEIGAIERFDAEDLEKGEAALACYETYREVVELHQPLREVARGVAFELFGEEVSEPFDGLVAGLE